LVPGGLSQGTGISTFDVASSLDASALFALGLTGTGSSQLTSFSTASNSATANLTIPGVASAVSVGPNGLIYVSLANEILEIDPATLKVTPSGTISVSGTPGRLLFTPDGQYAIAANQSSIVGSTLLFLTVASHAISSPNLGVPLVTSLQPYGLNSVVALAAGGLYQITVNPVTVNSLAVSGLTGTIHDIAVSNEVPSSGKTVQYLYAVTSDEVYQINPTNNSIASKYPLAGGIEPGALAFAAPALTLGQTRAASLLAFGTTQSVLPNTHSHPLVVRILDANSHPVMGVAVQFQASSASAILSSPTTSTGASGYARTSLSAPAATGPITVTATAGSLSANFNIDVSSSAGGSGPQLTIVAGQGQLLPSNTNTQLGPGYGSPLQVLATDASGNPLSGIPVTFSVPPAAGTIVTPNLNGSSETVNTDATGMALVNFLTTNLPSNNTTGFAQTSVTASAPGMNSVSFYITTVSQSPGISVYIQAPTPGQVLTGAEGTVLPAAVSVQVASGNGTVIPNASLILNQGTLNPSLYPSVSCNNATGGFVLTAANGMANCDVLFGPRVGSGSYTIDVGYTHTSVPFRFIVTAGAAATVQIVQGNNQTGTPGKQLPLALLVHVTDSGGNPATNAPVTWEVLPNSSLLTLNQPSANTNFNGDASSLVTPGTVGGPAQVKVTVGAASATFNITVNIPSAGIQKVSGDQQTTTISTAFAQPLTVKVVDSSGNGVNGAQVNFQVAGGDATLGSSSVITDATGQASTTVTAGATAGTITVTATSSTFTASFTLTSQLPGPSNVTIVNGASFDPNTGISPGSIATIRGMGILPGVTGLLVATPDSTGHLPTTFSGVTVTFDGTAAPIFYVQDTNGADQVTVQVPFEVQPGAAVSMVVQVANSGSATISIPVKPLAPGVFTAVYGNKTYAAAVRPDGSYVSPTNPAQRGEDIQLYITGLGQATPTIATGAPGVADQQIVSSMIVGLNNGGVPLISAVYGPGLIGPYVVIIHVPADTAPGPYQPVGIIGVGPDQHLYYAQPTYIPIQ
jgi:uncharacterized protein (TIGR03437 family)